MNEIKTHDTMTTEQQNIAIFESLGWKYLPPIKGDSTFIVRPENLPRWKNGRHIAYKGDTPSYTTDLNACREFEIWLLKNHPNLRAVYRRILIECVGSDGLYWMATAPQRCEAFLKTIGKWVTA